MLLTEPFIAFCGCGQTEDIIHIPVRNVFDLPAITITAECRLRSFLCSFEVFHGRMLLYTLLIGLFFLSVTALSLLVVNCMLTVSLHMCCVSLFLYCLLHTCANKVYYSVFLYSEVGFLDGRLRLVLRIRFLTQKYVS